MKTVHYFAFYPHNLPKITDFSPWSSMNPKIQNLYIFDENGWRCNAPLSVFQVANQSSSDAQSVFFRFQFPHLWDFTPTFIMISPYFHDDLLLLLGWFTPTFMMRWLNIDWIPMDIALNLFLTLIEALPCREYKIFKPRK